MKGIILAGGRATRLYPVTKATCKQLLPVYDKPMVYYPLSVLMLAGIRDILIISTSKDIDRFQALFGDGSDLGLNISYIIQNEPKGIAQSFVLGESFIGNTSVSLILGDNIFYGHNLTEFLKEVTLLETGALIFAYYVNNPQRYGVIEFDKEHRAISIEEKPAVPKSNWAVTGLYSYDNQVIRIAKNLKPSGRGELEITDINNEYLRNGQIKIKLLGRGYAWLDTGTYDSLIDASVFIKTIEERQGLKIGCVEEIAYRRGYISGQKLQELAESMNTSYGEYLLGILKGRNEG